MLGFIITYDAGAPKHRDAAVREAIKMPGPAWLQVGSTVVVHSDWHTAEQIRDLLLPHLPEGAKLLVVKSGVQSAWAGMPEHEAEFLKPLL